MTDPTDLGLPDIAPITLDDELFGDILDYAVSADAHDVDDSLVPTDGAEPEAEPEAPDADDFGDIDDVALPDATTDPFAGPGAETGDPDSLGVDEIGVTDDVAGAGIDDLDAGPHGDIDGGATGFGPDGLAADGFGDAPVDDGGLDATPEEDPGLGVDMDW